MKEALKKRTRIKICGLTRLEDIQAVNEAKPDFCGFIVEFPKSRRNVTAAQLRTLREKLDESILPVGVFVNAPVELPAQLLNEGTIALAQLHGQEDEAYIRQLKTMTDQLLIKAFSIKTEGDVKSAIRSEADYILLDQGAGGTGETFDWNLVPAIERPWFLAGGLGCDNLETAIKMLHPWAADLSSSVETDGYNAVQLAFEEIREKLVNKPRAGHFKKAGVSARRHLKEFRLEDIESLNVGDTISADTFASGDKVDITGITKGRGYTGVVKRWNAHILRMTHGTGPIHRQPGSMGANSTPSRIYKNKHMAGQYGNEQVTVLNLEVVKVDTEKNLIAVKGAVPGAKGGIVFLRDSVKA